MSRLRRRTFTRACLGMMIPLGGSCGRKEGAGREKSGEVDLAALFDSRRDPFRNSQSLLLERLAQTRAGTELLTWDAGGNVHLQSDQLAASLAARPDYLLVFPVNPTALGSSLARSPVDPGPRMFIFSDLPSPIPRTTVIVCPDVEIGRTAGEFVARSLRLKATEEGRAEPAGRVVEFTIAPPDAPHAGYSEGFSKSLSQHPGITIVHQAPCKMLGEDTAERVNEVLRLVKDFDVIFAHNDLIAHAASKAVAAARPDLTERILVMGVDGNLGKGGGKEMIIKGEIDATICKPPLVDLAWAIIQKCLADPKFNPKPRYDVAPLALNYESALEVSRTGLPMPPIE